MHYILKWQIYFDHLLEDKTICITKTNNILPTQVLFMISWAHDSFCWKGVTILLKKSDFSILPYFKCCWRTTILHFLFFSDSPSLSFWLPNKCLKIFVIFYTTGMFCKHLFLIPMLSVRFSFGKSNIIHNFFSYKINYLYLL